MSESNVSAMTDVSGKYLTFHLAQEEYGVEILKVQEIIGIMNITRVPRAPEYVRGVINLRGKVIPVIELRKKFSMNQIDYTSRTCIIVVQVERGGQNVVMGIIVDEVSEVVDIRSEQIDPAPSFGNIVDNDFILGMGKVADKVLILLDIGKVLSDHETEKLCLIAPSEQHG